MADIENAKETAQGGSAGTVPTADANLPVGVFERIARLFKRPDGAETVTASFGNPGGGDGSSGGASKIENAVAPPERDGGSDKDKDGKNLYLTRGEFLKFFEKLVKSSDQPEPQKKDGITTGLPVKGGAEIVDPVTAAFLKRNPKLKID
jgi:hypothetical protein